MQDMQHIAPLDSLNPSSVRAKLNEIIGAVNDLQTVISAMVLIGKANNTGARLAQIEEALKLDAPAPADEGERAKVGG